MTALQDQIRQLHQQAAQIASAGKWDQAATLLERCCRLTGYTSSQLNAQWMVAADRVGSDMDLAKVSLKLARQAWKIGARNGALEFLQLALFKNPRDAQSRSEALQCAYDWLPSIAPAGPHEPATLELGRRKLRIGHLLGLLNPTHAPTKLVRLLTSDITRKDADSFIYSSEWASAWFHNWTHRRQSGPENFLQEFNASGLYIHDAEGGFIERARQLAARIRQDALDVLIVHASISEMITSLVALARPARRQVNVNHASEMDLACFDGVVHMFENGLLRSAARGIPMIVIPPASDMAQRLKEALPLSKKDFGVPEESTLSGTFGNLYKIENPAYRQSLRAILNAHPRHHHLIAGGGEDRATRIFLKDARLEDRVHILGPRTDIPSLLLLLDFYLASHPYPGALSEIEAMAAACPVISVRDQAESHYNAGAEVVGIPECIIDPGDTAALVALASRYLQDSGWGHAIGNRLKERFEQRFKPSGVVSHHLAFYRSLLEP
jgi:hypothetical protein